MLLSSPSQGKSTTSQDDDVVSWRRVTLFTACPALQLHSYGCGYNFTFQSQCQDSKNQEQGNRNKRWLYQRWNIQEDQTQEWLFSEGERSGECFLKLTLASWASIETNFTLYWQLDIGLFYCHCCTCCTVEPTVCLLNVYSNFINSFCTTIC